MKREPMASCRRLHFIGTVQGVGFRWTAKKLADRLRLSGWVRNDADGGVTLVAKGPDADIDTLVENIDEAFGIYIETMESREEPAGKIGAGFDIIR